MAIVGNISNEIGDVMIIKSAIPIIGIINLTSYTDLTTGETGTSYFQKEFRYSLDGFIFSTWEELTDINLQAITIRPVDYFFIEYRYTHKGSVVSDLIFNSVTINGDFEYLSCGVTFENSIFAEFIQCPDEEVLGWCINVTQKLYEKGIVPSYIDRGNREEDQDYIDFWRTIAFFFAILVIYARKFENFSSNKRWSNN
jgi:hypothetical protein